jgi:hypothetical protein
VFTAPKIRRYYPPKNTTFMVISGVKLNRSIYEKSNCSGRKRWNYELT